MLTCFSVAGLFVLSNRPVNLLSHTHRSITGTHTAAETAPTPEPRAWRSLMRLPFDHSTQHHMFNVVSDSNCQLDGIHTPCTTVGVCSLSSDLRFIQAVFVGCCLSPYGILDEAEIILGREHCGIIKETQNVAQQGIKERGSSPQFTAQSKYQLDRRSSGRAPCSYSDRTSTGYPVAH